MVKLIYCKLGMHKTVLILIVRVCSSGKTMVEFPEKLTSEKMEESEIIPIIQRLIHTNVFPLKYYKFIC